MDKWILMKWITGYYKDRCVHMLHTSRATVQAGIGHGDEEGRGVMVERGTLRGPVIPGCCERKVLINSTLGTYTIRLIVTCLRKTRDL